jgi:hypothetical protein
MAVIVAGWTVMYGRLINSSKVRLGVAEPGAGQVLVALAAGSAVVVDSEDGPMLGRAARAGLASLRVAWR